LEKVLRLQLYKYHLRATAGQPSQHKYSEAPASGVSEDRSSQKNAGVLDLPHDSLDKMSRNCRASSVRSAEDASATASCERKLGGAGRHDANSLTRGRAGANRDCTVPCSCLRDAATGVMCYSKKSHGDHVTGFGRGGDGEVEGEGRVLGLLAQEVQQILPDAVVETVS